MCWPARGPPSHRGCIDWCPIDEVGTAMTVSGPPAVLAALENAALRWTASATPIATADRVLSLLVAHPRASQSEIAATVGLTQR
jgi:hypothetical protein